MDERTHLFFWLLMGEGFFALLGGVFGAITGIVHARQGRFAGTAVGQGLVRAFARMSEGEMSPTQRGGLAGGADGVLLGMVVGTVVGLVAAWQGAAAWTVFRPVALMGMMLVGLALALGGFAGLMASMGVRAVVGLFAGAVCCALLGYALGGPDGLFLGTLLGGGLGVLAARWHR